MHKSRKNNDTFGLSRSFGSDNSYDSGLGSGRGSSRGSLHSSAQTSNSASGYNSNTQSPTQNVHVWTAPVDDNLNSPYYGNELIIPKTITQINNSYSDEIIEIPRINLNLNKNNLGNRRASKSSKIIKYKQSSRSKGAMATLHSNADTKSATTQSPGEYDLFGMHEAIRTQTDVRDDESDTSENSVPSEFADISIENVPGIKFIIQSIGQSSIQDNTESYQNNQIIKTEEYKNVEQREQREEQIESATKQRPAQSVTQSVTQNTSQIALKNVIQNTAENTTQKPNAAQKNNIEAMRPYSLSMNTTTLNQLRASQRPDVVSFIHSMCSDGCCCGIIAQSKCEEEGKRYTEYYITPAKFKYDINMCADKEVLFMDVVPAIDIILNVCKIARSVTIIDHHISNKPIIEELRTLNDPKIRLVYSTECAATILAWRYFRSKEPMMYNFLVSIANCDIGNAKKEDWCVRYYFEQFMSRESGGPKNMRQKMKELYEAHKNSNIEALNKIYGDIKFLGSISYDLVAQRISIAISRADDYEFGNPSERKKYACCSVNSDQFDEAAIKILSNPDSNYDFVFKIYKVKEHSFTIGVRTRNNSNVDFLNMMGKIPRAICKGHSASFNLTIEPSVFHEWFKSPACD